MKTREDFSYIYGAVRTPIGKFMGALSSAPAPELAAAAIKAALARSGVGMDLVDEVILGNVLSAGLGQAPARQAGIQAGLPDRVGATTINKVCGSGLKAVMLADDSIRLSNSRFIIAGGMENMSLAPFLLPAARRGFKLGNRELVDSLIHDGLTNSFDHCHMGEIAEKLAATSDKYNREAQDRYALESYRRARAAQDQCLFSDEIVPVQVRTGKEFREVAKDEQPYANELDNLPRLSPAFVKPGGSITAGNASKVNDGAAALVLGPWDETLKPMAKIVGHATHAQAPGQFPTAPVKAIQLLLEKWELTLDEVDLFEINEAFSVAILAVCGRLGLSLNKVNIRGGAVALGHPIGASGARILVTLLYALQKENLKRGIAAICLGGGESVALGIEMQKS
ncbi:MAG: thiolase family protein [Nitrospinaceae bacterium]